MWESLSFSLFWIRKIFIGLWKNILRRPATNSIGEWSSIFPNKNSRFYFSVLLSFFFLSSPRQLPSILFFWFGKKERKKKEKYMPWFTNESLIPPITTCLIKRNKKRRKEERKEKRRGETRGKRRGVSRGEEEKSSKNCLLFDPFP